MAKWIETAGEAPNVQCGTWIEARGRYGDIYGPLPAEMFNPDAWTGNMFHAAHDIHAYRVVDRG